MLKPIGLINGHYTNAGS